MWLEINDLNFCSIRSFYRRKLFHVFWLLSAHICRQWRRQDLVRGGAWISVSEKVKAQWGIYSPPLQKNPGKIFLVKYHVNSDILLIFHTYIFGQKISCAPKLTEPLYAYDKLNIQHAKTRDSYACVCTCELWKVEMARKRSTGQETARVVRVRDVSDPPK